RYECDHRVTAIAAEIAMTKRHGLGALRLENWIRRMKKLLLITTALIALGSAAQAADLAARPYTKAPPMVAATIYDWSGFYIGVNGGGAWSHNDYGFGGSNDASGGTAGGQIGYRWQTGPVVFGLEAQGNWADISGDTNSFDPRFRNHSKMD